MQTLQQRFPDSPTVRDKVAKELRRLEKVGKPAPCVRGAGPCGQAGPAGIASGQVRPRRLLGNLVCPCLAELPRLQDAYEKYHDAGFEILSVSLDETRPAVADFVKVAEATLASGP